MIVTTIVGARPQFIKAFALSRAIDAAGGITEFVVHTGQHHDHEMSEVFFRELGLRAPDVALGIHGGLHGQMTGRMLEAIEGVLVQRRPDAVLVYGDTNTTLAGALAAVKLGVPVVHVEAGLRSFDLAMPEEINRVVVDRVSSVLCCPTAAAVANLRNEGFGVHVDRKPRLPMPWVEQVGDVMLDTLRHFRDVAAAKSAVLERLGLTPRAYALLTVHRAENTATIDCLDGILSAVSELSTSIPVVFPVHPRTRHLLERSGPRHPLAAGIRLTDPLSYLDFLHLHRNARAMITDSGGLQKEALFLGVPCLTLRDTTEWPETIAAGGNRLMGSRPVNLAAALDQVRVPDESSSQAFGSGHAADRIVDLLRELPR
jgi:UDP-GlcNAc3NAcA epimerase